MDFTPKTKRIIVAGISVIGLAISVGWAMGKITPANALIPLMAIITGLFTLLKGGE